jgi:hypothetical protein
MSIARIRSVLLRRALVVVLFPIDLIGSSFYFGALKLAEVWRDVWSGATTAWHGYGDR